MRSVIALGFFDGVHLGHGALLSRTAELAAQDGLRAVAMTFDRSPGKDGRLLTSVADRTRLIRGLYGVDEVVVLPFTEEFMHMPWDLFLESLVRDHGAAHLVCGWDYRFGYRGAGDPAMLSAWCREHGLGCDVVDRLILDGITVSSTILKDLVEAGDVEAACRYYGHPHTLSGTVLPGRHLGSRLGFPTANLEPAPELVLPRDGVYAVRGTVDGQSCPDGEHGGPEHRGPEHRGRFSVFRNTENRPLCSENRPLCSENRPLCSEQAVIRCTGVCNVGTRPTVDGHHRTVETWLSDFDGDLYGSRLTVEFFRYLRPERKFSSLEELRGQVLRDRAAAQDFFQTQGLIPEGPEPNP